MKKTNNNSTIEIADYLASKGDVDLALKLVKTSLEKLYIEKQTTMQGSTTSSEELNEIESELNQRYLKFKTKYEENKKSYWEIFFKTLIIASIVSLLLIITTSITFYQIKSSLIDDISNSVQSELHEVFDQIKIEISGIANEIKAEIPIISHQIKLEIPIISKRIRDKINEIDAIDENKTKIK